MKKYFRKLLKKQILLFWLKVERDCCLEIARDINSDKQYWPHRFIIIEKAIIKIKYL